MSGREAADLPEPGPAPSSLRVPEPALWGLGMEITVRLLLLEQERQAAGEPGDPGGQGGRN